LNLLFTAAYNSVVLSLAALGFLPPILAAAAHSILDLITLGNSSVCCDNKSKAGDGVRVLPTPESIRKAFRRRFCIMKLFAVLTYFKILINNML
jgi:hypothetical protein